jgi:hypothetical protein
MLIFSPLSAYFDDVIPQQPTLSNDGKQRQPALGDFTSPIAMPHNKTSQNKTTVCGNNIFQPPNSWFDL